MSFLFIYNYAFCFVFSLYEKSQIDVKMEREEIYVSAKLLIQGPNWILLHVVCSGWIFYFSIFTMLRFRRSVRFRKTSWSRLKHFFWSPRSQTETVWPSTKHACCVGRSLYKKNTQFVATKTAGNVSRRPQKDNHHRPPLSPAATGG